MGNIRGQHISNGVYTSLRSVGARKTTPKPVIASTPNVTIVYKKKSQFDTILYYGYYNVTTYGGKKTSDTYELLSKITENIIKTDNRFKKEHMTEYSYLINNGENIIIPMEISSPSFDEYFDLCDAHNKSLVLIVDYDKYINNKVVIKDSIFFEGGENLLPTFDFIKKISIDGIDYAVLALLDECCAYAPVGTDKIITPVKVMFGQ